MAVDELHTAERSAAPTLATRAAGWAQRAPGQVAIRAKDRGIWREYTWGEVWELVLDAAHALLELGIERGDRVSIQAENRPEWVVLELAAVAAGGASVGLHPVDPLSPTRHILTDCTPTVHLAEDQEQADKVLAIDRADLSSLRRIVYVEQRGMEGYDDDRLISWEAFLELGRTHRSAHPDAVGELMARTSGDDLAALVYTSGATGPPKGVMFTHANVDFAIGRLVLWGGRYPGGKAPGPRDLVVSAFPLAHVAERSFSTWSLVGGGSIVHFVESVDTVESDLRDVQPTIFFGVPRVWERLHGAVLSRAADASWLKRHVVGFGLGLGRRVGRTRAANGGRHTFGSRLAYMIGWVLVFRALKQRIGLRRVRYAAVGGAPIAPQVLEFFLGIGIQVFEFYGLTESAGVATSNLPGRVRLGTAGEAFPDVDLRVDSATGEIQLRHDGNFSGYWGRPDATSAALTDDGWLRTGDLGELVDGHLEVLDRIEDLIVGPDGTRLPPSEIENALKTSVYVRQAMVVADEGDRLTALLGIEPNAVSTWALRRNISVTTYRDMVEKPEVIELIDDEIRQLTEEHPQLARIAQHRLIPKELGHEDGELTAAQVLKRHVVQGRYADLVQATPA
jgi:long-chain acyl-CoA synthetase